MAAPTYQAKGTIGTGTGSSINFTYMGSINAADILILAVYSNGMGTITPNASWNSLTSVFIPFAPSAPSVNFRTYWKSATGSESGSESVSRSGHSGSSLFAAQVYQFRGDSYLSIEDSETTGSSTTTTITWPALTVGGTERTLCAIVLSDGTNPGVPASYTSSATDSIGSTYLELNRWENVSSDGATTATGGGLTPGWCSVHISFYNNTPSSTVSRSFIVN